MYIQDSCKIYRGKTYISEIYIKNLEPKYDNGIHIEIPPQNCKVCDFLSESKKEIPFRIGPRYITDYEKYGRVPNVTTDTLRIVRNKIFYYKKKDREGIGFIFKRKL